MRTLRRAVFAIFALGLTSSVVACTDPGCIRNSECADGYECKDSRCVSLAPDAGRDASVDAGADAGVLDAATP